MRVTCLLVGAMVIGCAAPSAGQVTSPADVQPPAVTPAEDRPVTPNEDIEPRIVGASVAAVRSRLHKGRQLLRLRLARVREAHQVSGEFRQVRCPA